jgi:hypothetical protein
MSAGGKPKRSIVKKRTSFYLLRALVLVPALAAPAFAHDNPVLAQNGKDVPSHATQMAHANSADRPLLMPLQRQWWKDD